MQLTEIQNRPIKGKLQSWRVLTHTPRATFVFCFITIGTFLAPSVYFNRYILELVAVGTALILTGYRLDELRGRHCGTSFTDRELVTQAAIGLAIAIPIGIYLIVTVSIWLVIPMAIEALMIIGYNYEVLGSFHTTVAFGLSWGVFPILFSYYLQTLEPINVAYVPIIAIGVFAFSFAWLHIKSYGDTKCYQSERCVDFKRNAPGHNNLCHGQHCINRLTMPKEVAKLSWKLIDTQVFIVLSVTVFIVLAYYIGV